MSIHYDRQCRGVFVRHGLRVLFAVGRDPNLGSFLRIGRRFYRR